MTNLTWIAEKKSKMVDSVHMLSEVVLDSLSSYNLKGMLLRDKVP